LECEDETDDGGDKEEDADWVEIFELSWKREVFFVLWWVDVKKEQDGEKGEAAGW